MRSLIPLLALLFLAFGCEPDDEGDGNGGPNYPTDNITLRPTTKALVLENYDPTSGMSIAPEIFRYQAEDLFADDMNSLLLITDPMKPLYSVTADSLAQAVNLGMVPSLRVNNRKLPLDTNFFNTIETVIDRGSLVSVAHAITDRDSAWIIDNKVQFYVDTSGTNFRIATYLLVDAPAINYESLDIDLRTASLPDLIESGDSLSVWEIDIPNVDSSDNVINAGDLYHHPYVMVGGYDTASVFGRPLATYTPFGAIFQENDIIGTQSTPIRHFFLKPEEYSKDTLNFEFEPVFLSVVWYVDEITGEATVLNSYQSRGRR